MIVNVHRMSRDVVSDYREYLLPIIEKGHIKFFSAKLCFWGKERIEFTGISDVLETHSMFAGKEGAEIIEVAGNSYET